MNLSELLAEIDATPGCAVLPASGVPVVAEGHTLPPDLKRFYELCGGVDLFHDSEYATSIVPSQEFTAANPVIIGGQDESDISSSWYIVGSSGGTEYLTIDLSRERLGRCYDSFSDRHGVAGSCPIIATSFTDLLTRLFLNRGEYWYWLRDDFQPNGDAYD